MSWKDTLAAIAPTLATVIGGPLAGTATKFLTGRLLGKETTDTAELEQFILGASPDQLAEIKDLDNRFKLEMERLGVDVFKLEVADKGNAREHNKGSYMPAVLSVGLSIFVAGIVYALFYINPPAGARDVLFMLLGIVVKEWANSMHYWYGTTRSSSEKTNLLSK